VPVFFTKVFRFTYAFFYRKWFFDELYTFVFVRGAKALGRGFWKIFDGKIIDRFLPNGAATVSWLTAGGLSKLQSGFVAHYATVMVLGLVAFLSYFLFKTVLPL
jgi:NADH-quinone oxidoreductase subunit L